MAHLSKKSTKDHLHLDSTHNRQVSASLVLGARTKYRCRENCANRPSPVGSFLPIPRLSLRTGLLKCGTLHHDCAAQGKEVHHARRPKKRPNDELDSS